jgi:hypothetical protein
VWAFSGHFGKDWRGGDGDYSACVVGLMGVEPTHPCGRQNLNLVRIPVPPQPHSDSMPTGTSDATIPLGCDMTVTAVTKNSRFCHRQQP